ncbi:MAG: transglycosylase SLT domain-containing protein [Fervidobacterium sp.]|jgi:soluble lytic murein transglycosylase-like protein
MIERFSKLITFLTLLIISSLAFSQAPGWFADVVAKKRTGVKEKTTVEFIEELWNTICAVSEKYEMDPVFITTVIAYESNFANAKGPGGVLGMMQILPSTAQIIAKLLSLEVPKDWNQLLTDYKLNITYGTAYLSYLYKKTGSLSKALESYNNGKNKEIYAKNVMSLYDKYKQMHENELAKSRKGIDNQIMSMEEIDKTSTATNTEAER